MVYFIQADAEDTKHGPVKIGYVNTDAALEARMRSLQVGNPYPLRIRVTIPGAGRRTEKWLHAAFASNRMRGEWFRHSDSLEGLIVKLKTNPAAVDDMITALGVKRRAAGRPKRYEFARPRKTKK